MANEICTKEQFYNEINKIYREHGKINKKLFDKYSDLNLSFTYYCLKYGGIKNICKELNVDYFQYNEISKEELTKRAKSVLNKYGKINKELCTRNKISSSSVRKVFGSYTNLFKEIGYDNNFHRDVEKQEVLNDMKNIFEKYNSISSTIYRKYGKYSTMITDRLGGWTKLVEELGYKPLNKKVGLENMTVEVKEVIEEYGFISRELIDDNCSFTYQALSAHFKNKKELSNYFGYEDLFKYGRSSKEKQVSKILDEVIGESNYSREHSWEWLVNKNGKRMYVDFYIQNKNLVIEYDGEQHFKFIPRFHKTEEDFKKQLERDRLKNELLNEKGIKVVRIPYTDKITKEYICKLL